MTGGRGLGVGRIVLVHDPCEHSGLAATDRRGVDTGVLQSLPTRFQQQALLGIHRKRLAGGQPEELSVELPGVVEKAAFTHVARARVIGIRVEETIYIPAAILGNVADRISATGDQVPEALGRAGLAGQPAAHADDRHRLGRGGEQALILAAQTLRFLG